MSRPAPESDVIVVGSGAAGQSAALAAAGSRVTLLTKSVLGSGNSPWAQGGVAAAVAEGDSPALHAADTIAVGVGLNDPDAVRVLTTEGPDRVRELLAWGARFDRAADGDLALTREAAHSTRRILHAADATGVEIIRTLREAVTASDAITVVEHATVVDVHIADGAVAGVLVDHGDGDVTVYPARAVILATGGIGRLYEFTTNPAEATADGIALAARAGATLRDLEFVQFHPTALAATGADPLPLLTEALRGEGAHIVDETGRRFVLDSHPDGELAPRDVVARAIARHRLDGHQAFLEAGPELRAGFAKHFPTVLASCLAHGIDPRRDLMPVSPAQHYHMGGIATDLDGRTDIDGLFAAGEAAATGTHGANRLASNSLLEALVFGARAGHAAADLANGSTAPRPATGGRRRPEVRFANRTPDAQRSINAIAELRHLMWRHVGILRDGAGLRAACDALAALDHPDLTTEARNMVQAARLIAESALTRTESRGAHQRLDHPDTDPSWACHLDCRLPAAGAGTAIEFECAGRPDLAGIGS
ncbi:MAG: L-aspartate oxidase [Ilumatobacteraceae bacterium]